MPIFQANSWQDPPLRPFLNREGCHAQGYPQKLGNSIRGNNILDSSPHKWWIMPRKKWLVLLLFWFFSGLGQRGLGNGKNRAQGSLELVEGGFVTHAVQNTIFSLWSLQ